MVTARERMQLAKEGQAARNAEEAQIEGEMIAQQKINDAIMQKQSQQMRQSREADMINQVGQAERMQGQIEGQEQERINMLNAMNPNPQSPGIPFDYNQDFPNPEGLGLGSQTIEGMQQQQVMQEGAIEEAAIGMIQQLGEAQAQGASPEQLNQMFESIPPELKGKVIEMKQMADMQKQQTQAQQVSQTPTGRPVDPYGITAGSAQLLQETMQPQQGQGQSPQQPQQR